MSFKYPGRSSVQIRPELHKGRASHSNQQARFRSETREQVDDGWGTIEEDLPYLETVLTVDNAKTVISYNQSPDVGFDRSINPYRGCEHGCIYCFARPTHAYLNLSPGLDFESRLFYKPDADVLLRKELNQKKYAAAPLALGINTDAYQPVEKKVELTRRLLSVLAEHRHPVTIVTKSSLIERDLDILTSMAKDNIIRVIVSVTSLDSKLSQIMEPRAAAPHRRLKTIEKLHQSGIPVGVLVAPIIPVLTDHELENILEVARQAGVSTAGYVLIRLPHEVKFLFNDWLETHFPQKSSHVMERIRDCRGGKEYDAKFGERMRGRGVYADLISKRFDLACKKFAYRESSPLNSDLFVKTDMGNTHSQQQLDLF